MVGTVARWGARTHLLPPRPRPRPPRVVSRRPWRPGCRFAGPIRGHLACWCWSSTAFHQLGRARQFAEARGSERWARDREGHFRVSQTQGKGADANVLVVPVGCRPELAPGRLCESESGQRAQGQKERREQVSNGCQLFALVLFFFLPRACAVVARGVGVKTDRNKNLSPFFPLSKNEKLKRITINNKYRYIEKGKFQQNMSELVGK